MAADFAVEEAFSASLELLFDHPNSAIVVSPHSLWSHERTGIVLAIPSVQNAANWSLHADAVWTASLFIAEHILMLSTELDVTKKRVLELGAGTGLAGIAIARLLSPSSIVITDYPDDGIISTLRENVGRNQVHQATVIPVSWGDAKALDGQTFDVIVAADTLWNIEHHESFCQTLGAALSKDESSRVHLFAAFHTGRYTMQHFMRTAQEFNFEIDALREYRASDAFQREWQVERMNETMEDMARWLLYIRLRRR